MSLNYKTTKGNKVSIDYSQNYYEWKDVREYVRWDTNECKVYLDLWRDFIKIDETNLESWEIDYLLGNKDFMEDFDLSEKEDWEEHMKQIEDKNWIVYFRVRDWWSNGLDLHAWVSPEEANWFIIRKKDNDDKWYDRDELKETLNYFRAYVEWTFVEIRIYSPVVYVNENDPEDKITQYRFEDWWEYFLSNEQALDSIDTNVWWEVLKDTETEDY